jgi:GTP-binding protein EngB required for normal cell division
MYISKLVVFLMILVNSISAKLFLLMGETGVGKSSFINWNIQKKLAEIGEDYSSMTQYVKKYNNSIGNDNFTLIDTPGIFDTAGLSNEDILNLIQLELLKMETLDLSGVIVILDGKRIRQRIGEIASSVQQILGNECLIKSTIFMINKFNSLSELDKSEIKSHLQSELKKLGVDNNLICIDTFDNLFDYWTEIRNKIFNFQGCPLNFFKNFSQKVKEYYDLELVDQNNYVTELKKILKTKEVEKTKTEMKTESYPERDCRRVCTSHLLMFCLNKRWVCSTYYREKTVPYTIKWTVTETYEVEESKRRLKNELTFYENKAKQKLVDEMRNEIFIKLKRKKNEL